MDYTKIFKTHYDNGNLFDAENLIYLMDKKYNEIKKEIEQLENKNIDGIYDDIILNLQIEKNKLHNDIRDIKYLKYNYKFNCKCGVKIFIDNYKKHLQTNKHKNNT